MAGNKKIIRPASQPRGEAVDHAPVVESDEISNTDETFADTMATFSKYIRAGICDPYLVDLQDALNFRVRTVGAVKSVEKAAGIVKPAIATPTAPATAPEKLVAGNVYTIALDHCAGLEVTYIKPSEKFPGKFLAKVSASGSTKYPIGAGISFPLNVWREKIVPHTVRTDGPPPGYRGEPIQCVDCPNTFYQKEGRGKKPIRCPKCGNRPE